MLFRNPVFLFSFPCKGRYLTQMGPMTQRIVIYVV
jgi:hypothetical protein